MPKGKSEEVQSPSYWNRSEKAWEMQVNPNTTTDTGQYIARVVLVVFCYFSVSKSTTIFKMFQIFRVFSAKKRECLPFSVANDSKYSCRHAKYCCKTFACSEIMSTFARRLLSRHPSQECRRGVLIAVISWPETVVRESLRRFYSTIFLVTTKKHQPQEWTL